MRLHHQVALSLLLTTGLSAPARGQLPDPSRFIPGAVLERVVSTSAPGQAYALFLPGSYDTASRWPVLLVMDPRGRAMVPLRLIRGAAAAAELAGEQFAAYRLYRAVAEDFRGSRDVTEAYRRAARLEDSKPVRRALARQREILDRYHEYFATLRRVILDLRRGDYLSRSSSRHRSMSRAIRWRPGLRPRRWYSWSSRT